MIGNPEGPGYNFCTDCKGSGRNPKKRRQSCRTCRGSGKENVCGRCFKPTPCGGVPDALDAQCENPPDGQRLLVGAESWYTDEMVEIGTGPVYAADVIKRLKEYREAVGPIKFGRPVDPKG
jgi:hypothetical protein